jgi:S1-C subfamily serine protease
MRRWEVSVLILGILCNCSYAPKQVSKTNEQIAVGASFDSIGAGINGDIAALSVMRLICRSAGLRGTGFLHKSGRIITAAHVVSKCSPDSIFAITSQGKTIIIDSIVTDIDLDIAIVKPKEQLNLPSLPISSKENFSIGLQVTTWGFPTGYNGLIPMLTVGFLAGADQVKTDSGKVENRWLINAAFNAGNSGSPVLDLNDGSVLGVVLSKLAPTPFPSEIQSALEALKENSNGFQYEQTFPNGTKNCF